MLERVKKEVAEEKVKNVRDAGDVGKSIIESVSGLKEEDTSVGGVDSGVRPNVIFVDDVGKQRVTYQPIE